MVVEMEANLIVLCVHYLFSPVYKYVDCGVTNSLCLREGERFCYYFEIDGCIAQMLLCQNPLMFASERPKSENNKFTKLLTQSEIETHVQCSIVPSLLVCEAGHIYLHSLSKCRSVYYL